jgi:hypothetical protein
MTEEDQEKLKANLSKLQAAAHEASEALRLSQADVERARRGLALSRAKHKEAMASVKYAAKLLYGFDSRSRPSKDQCGMGDGYTGLAQRSKLYGHAANTRNPQAFGRWE